MHSWQRWSVDNTQAVAVPFVPFPREDDLDPSTVCISCVFFWIIQPVICNQKKQIIILPSCFTVPSCFTTMIILEKIMMFKKKQIIILLWLSAWLFFVDHPSKLSFSTRISLADWKKKICHVSYFCPNTYIYIYKLCSQVNVHKCAKIRAF